MVDYSIAIRTLGTADGKYQKLLDSINSLNIKPKKIIVMLPYGYSEPKQQLGYEEFHYCKKSMVLQRIRALDYIDTKYVLFCDDDIEFLPDFIDKLLYPLENLGYDVSAGPLLDLWPPNSFKYKIASLLGGACSMMFNRQNNYIRILRTGGWSYNYNFSNYDLCETESLPWACFLMKTRVAKDICMEEEMWLEKNGYASFDDRVMFYKVKRYGYRLCVVRDAKYLHNDAQTSLGNVSKNIIFSGAFNHFVFWHRFIFKFDELPYKILDVFCISYYIVMSLLYNIFLIIFGKRTFKHFLYVTQGFIDAIRFVNSKEYKKLLYTNLKKEENLDEKNISSI